MEKRYYSQVAYLLKAVLIIVVIGVGFYIATQVSHKIATELSIKLRKDLVVIEYTINAIVGIIAFLSILVILLRGKPQISINDTTLRTNRFKRDFSELKSYHKGRGGSEPYVISHDGKQFDIELSWFSKKDRNEIEAFIINQIKAAN
ncbi:hypothetical protein U8527_02925 [Kordia algicida OT-1]|uniref:Uncharacterized protein n=1 Tax=Kordia algicida OT-1 TaxID=391587 RepID=A9DNS6_9FLAO|nr:hypothetical protein [Kordia algicida]EDP97266.1 hypothetical protein KAOT1_18927 [Kordia algicida OT-1]